MTQRRRSAAAASGGGLSGGAGCAALAGARADAAPGQTVSALSVPAPEAEPNAALPAGSGGLSG
ncbi:MAG: hypothetical protein ACLUIR_05810 [Faecalibacterium prausnitzii]